MWQKLPICSKLIIPVINEVFGEEYTGDEIIDFSPNEHYINKQGGIEEKRITDESFSSGFIDEFTKKTIMDMSERVLENIARSLICRCII